MTKVRDIIKRDIGVKVEGVVKVFDRASLATEIREYVVTDKIEEELKRIFDTFTYVSATLRRGGPVRDVMGIWISGFFGSGKSHFAKVLGHVLQNTPLDATGADRCIDVFARHLSDTPRGQDIRLRLGESKRGTETRVIAFEIKSRQSLSNPNSVGEILLSEFYRNIGLAENFVVARIERRLQRRGLLERLEAEYSAAFGVPWRSDDGRDDLMTVRRRLAVVLPTIEPNEYPDERAAKQALDDTFRHERITAEGVADELVAWVNAQKTTGGKSAHLVFVIDEMGTFIGDSNERITELNSLAEMIGNKGKGKVWLIVTSQQDLERVVDRTNFQPALIGRLNARFELKPHLISDEINKVVSERILKKHPSEEDELRELYRRHEGHIAQLADLKASRHLDAVIERSFIDAYPLLPHQIRLAQDIFEALSGFRISGGVRSMISVVMETLQDVADEDVGVLVSFDQIFDAVENDLLSQEYLGASGVRAIYESDQRMPDLPIKPARVLKVLWLLQYAKWVPRVPETMAKLLVRDLVTDVPSVRSKVEKTLLALQEAGYVARDEATGEWKFLNERERTIEQAIQEMIRPGGSRSISLAAVRRISQQMCKEDLVTRKRLGNFAITHGVAKVPFSFGVSLDGETIEAGADMEVRVLSPLAPGRSEEIEEIRRQNQAAGTRGRVVWWVADASDKIDARLRRYEALVKVTSDKRFIDDASADTQNALSEKRKERDELRQALVRDHEKAFLKGTMFYGGQEIKINGVSDFKEPVTEALTSLIPNVFPRFTVADRTFDFAKQLRALLNPSTAMLHSVAPELEFFDTQGNLQRESALVAQVLEVIDDLEDEGIDPLGAELLDARDRRGFKGFSRPPFGWPDELLRLVLAACFRAGAIFLERQSGTGPVPIYDYKASDEYFSKITSFKKVTFRIAETSLSVEQIKQASRVLIAMGVKGVPESGNAIASAIRELAASLRAPLDEAKLRQQQGLPISDSMLGASQALDSPMTAKDPTVVVTSFLAAQDAWVSLHHDLKALRQFLDAGRHHEFEVSQRLDDLVEAHPISDSHPQVAQFIRVRKDMTAIAAARQVIERWSDYRDAFEGAFRIYRDAYVDAYAKVRAEVEATIAAIKDGAAYREAPPEKRDAIIASVFGEGRVCHYPPIALSSVHSLLEAAGRRSLTSLAQALVALPGYRSQVEAELEELSRPPLPPDEKIYQWGPARLLGKRFRTEKEVDETLSTLGQELKKHIRDGYTVVVK
jgi:hypothetical protein